MNQLGATETGRKDRIVGLYSQAHNLAIGGNYAQALELYDRIATEVPQLVSKTHRINYERALCLWALGRIREAEQALRSCLRVRPDDPEFLRLLSEIQFAKQSIDAGRAAKFKREPTNVKQAEEADRLYSEVKTLLPLVQLIDIIRGLRVISSIEQHIVGRACGKVRNKLLNYLSIVQFARATGSKTIDSIEIGTLFGGSCLAKLFAMRDLGVQGKVVCIDPMSGFYDQSRDPQTGLAVTAEAFFENIERFGFTKQAVDLRQVKSSDPRATEGLREKSFATLLIDGDHSYRGVRYDWENYNRFVADNGIVLFDDYLEPNWPEVTVFANELIDSLPGGWTKLGHLGTTMLLSRPDRQREQVSQEPRAPKPAAKKFLARAGALNKEENLLAILDPEVISGRAELINELAQYGINRQAEQVSNEIREKVKCSSSAVEPAKAKSLVMHQAGVGRKFSELGLLLRLKYPSNRKNVLVDVGAHVGSFSKPFAERNWQVVAFEPEAANYQEFCRSLCVFPKVTCIKKAVSDISADKVPFYLSSEHWGIHSLKPFHPTHRLVGTVETIRLDEVLDQLQIDHVTILKIDVEGADFVALRSFDFNKLRPEVAICEFMDERSEPNFGYTHHDVANYMTERGYTAFISEWAPIREYGRKGLASEPHKFLRCGRYQPDSNPAWGNLIFVPESRAEQFAHALSAYLRDLGISITELRQDVSSQQLEPAAAQYQGLLQQEEVLKASNALLAEYRDKHRGQRCVIIGNGPSLNKMDLSFLKNEITFGVNRIYLLFDKWDFRPTYYVSVNPLVIEQSAGEIHKITSPKFLSLNGLPYVQNHRDNIFLQSIRRPSFSADPRNGLWEGHTVTYVAMQLAYFMGFSEVILIGVDHYFKTKGAPNKEIVSLGNDENHFHPDYFGKGVRWNLPDLEKSEVAYRLARQAFEAAGRRIIDATVDGHLTIFPKADYREIFFPASHAVKSVKTGLTAELIDTEFEDYFRNKSESIEPLTATTSPKFAPAHPVEQKQRYLVSAIVSTYNSERFLRGCLEDLENQTIANRLEIIVVNSGSQQNEEAIVNEFQQKYDNIVYIRTEQREGIYTAWNRAVRAARGQFITNANTDDRHRRDAFEILSHALEKHHDISLVYADCYVSSTPNEKYNENSKRRIYRYPEFSAIGAALHYQFGPQPMWRKKLHETIGYFDESYKAAGDHDFNLRFASHLKALHIAEPLGLYLEHPGAISFRDDIMSQEQRRIASTYRNAETIERLYKQAGIACDSPEEKARIHLDMGIRALEYYPPWKAGEPECNLQFSLQCFQRASELKPGWAAAYNNSAIVLASNGNFQDAAKLLQQISNSRQDATIDYNLKLISEVSSSRRAWSEAKLIPSGLSLPSQRDLSPNQKSSEPPAESLVRLQQKASSKSGKLKVLFYFDRIGNFNESSPAGTVIAILNFARALVRNRPGASINLTGNLVRYPEQYESFQIIPLPQADKRSDFLAEYDVVFFATHVRYFKGLVKPSGQIWVLYQHCWEADDPVSLAHMNDFDAVICLSELHGAFLRSQGIGTEKLVTVPNLIDTEIYSPKDISRNNHSIMYAGGIHPHKCIHTLLDAFQLVRQQVAEAELHIYGDGAMWRGGDDYGNGLKSKKPQGVYFHGYIDNKDMPQIYSRHSILCLPSKLESFGLVTVEAQACGCIPVVHNVGGVTTTLADGQTGFLYSPNIVEKLAEAILKAMAAIDTDSSIRQRAIDFVRDNLSMARAAEYISKLWDRLNLAEQIKTVRNLFESNNLIAGSASDANVTTRKQKSTGEHKAADGQIVIPYNESGLRDSLVSVIMPAYNAAEHIAEAIESVLIQNYRNFELIIVDDGSTDNTKDIVAGFKDDKIKYFHKQNAGPSSARNFAIKQARGQYIMPLDSDDMMTPDFIARHLQEFEKHPEADLVYSDVLLIDTNSNPIRVMKKPEYQDRRHMIRDLLRAGHPIVPFRLGIRKSVFDKIGLYDEKLMVAEDYDMMRRFVKHGLKVHHLSGALHMRRMSSDSLSRNSSLENAKSHFDVVKRFTDTFRYDELFPDVAWEKIPAEHRQSHAKCLAAVTFLGIGQTYVRTKSLNYAKTAFGLACSELNSCLERDPGNMRVRQLLKKSEFARSRCSEPVPQAAC